jgi:hypothetical protein
VVRKSMQFVALAAVGVLVARQWPDVRRYLKIKQLSAGRGHPENVPVSGRTAYPADAGDTERDGTGDFDSAARGGPKIQA